MADADGDRGVVEGRPYLVKWMSPDDNRMENVHGNSEVTYGLEPDKLDAEKDKTQKIMMLNKDHRCDAIELVCRDGGGPVG
ncbi:MAG: hypothetical protein EB168_06990, partial [Euryarchaeota archaeon]|nr:hypothetical protein [Euryarchaeota archaeon]